MEEKEETVSEEPEPSLKEDLKEEGGFFLKDIAVSTVGAAKRFGHGLVNTVARRPKIEDLKEEVEEHAKEIAEDIVS